jgi:hypothetical protein
MKDPMETCPSKDVKEIRLVVDSALPRMSLYHHMSVHYPRVNGEAALS